MTEYPLLMTDSNVRALLGRRKTQTRRLPSVSNCLVDGRVNRKLFRQLNFASQAVFVDEGPSPAGNPGPYLHVPHKNGETVHRVHPRYGIGDRIWIRETFRYSVANDCACYEPCNCKTGIPLFRANYLPKEPGDPPWKSTIYMPRKVARIVLEVERVRIERLQDISETDAIAEGCERDAMCGPISWYSMLWNDIHGATAWQQNPFLFVIELKPL